MTKMLAFPLLLAAACFAADNPLNGRWDIEVLDQKVPVGWWLEVRDAGTSKASARFVGAPSGQMDTAERLRIRGGELRFQVRGKRFKYKGEWSAKLNGDLLEGTHTTAKRPLVRWVGRRAPVIAEQDDGSWHEGAPVVLCAGKDVSNWLPLDTSKPLGWVAKDGIMTNQGRANNIYSRQKFWNFALHVEYRVQKGSNSGLGLRGRYEIQIMDDYGRAIDGHSSGGVYGRVRPTTNATRPAGEWQTYDIRLVGRICTVVLNGVKIIDKKEIEGLTAIAIDSGEGSPGPLVIQGDHGMAEFRSVVVTPLVQ